MYKSPVEIWLDDFMNKITTQIQENNEMQIMTSINQYVAVDKEELIKALNYDRQQYEKGFADAKAEYQRPQGEWVRMDVDHKTFYYCSECHLHYEYPFNFCPHCGAKMEVQTNDDKTNI